MDRVPSNYVVDQSGVDQQYHYSSIASGTENLQFASPIFIQDPINSVNRCAGLHNLDMSGASPVLNYSIQTGEEFAFEFMRDRLNQGSPFVPHTLNNPSYSTGYMELKSILGISHMGSESGSDLSVLANIERVPREFEANNSALLEDRSNYGITLSAPQASANFESTRGIAYSHESLRTDSTIMKVLCSFGGKIFPRPSDRKLRYVGGETHIIGIRKDITWQELMQKALTFYSQVEAIKYQLPGEELDSLVSVSSDEDLQNMIEEYKELEYQEGSQRLRMFLLSKKDLDDSQFYLGYVDGNSEFQYVIAVNGMDMAAAENPTLHSMGYSSATNLQELDMNGNQPETSTLIMETMAVSTSPIIGVVVPTSTVSHTEPAQATSSACQVTYQPFIYGNNAYQRETEQYHLHYGQLPNPAPYLENPTSMPLHRFGNQPGGMSEGQLQDGLEVLDLETSAKQMMSEDEGSREKNTGPKNFFSQEKDYSNSTRTYNTNVAQYHPAEESSAAVAVPDVDPSQFSLKKEGKPLETENIPPSVEVGYPVHVPELSGHDNGRISSSKLAHGYTNPENIPSDLCYSKPSAPPQRYQSERFPQKQAELLTRFSKSDDSLGSQLLAAHSHSETPQQHSAIKSDQTQGMNLVPSKSGEMMSSEDLCTDPEPVGDGLVQVQKCREYASSQQIVLEEGLKEAISIDIDDRFPRDYLYDMFSKAVSENFCSNVPLPNDESGLNLNMEDHESSHWSDFQESAQSDYVEKEVSVIDQDPIGFPSSSRTADESNKVLYHSKHLATDEVPTDNVSSTVHHGEDNQKDLPGFIRAGSQVTPSDYDYQTEISESVQFEAMINNMRTSESEYKDGKVVKKSVGLPPLAPSFGEFDVSTLQFIKNDDLEELKELGSGSFGTVYYGKWRGTDVAIKRIKKSCFTGRSSEQERLAIEFWREADILSKLHHPNVVAFYGVVRDGPGGTLATITEFMVDGSLRHALLCKDRYLDRLNRLIIAMDAAFGMEYLHSKNIVHFDLKCDNLLVNLTDPARPICKVGDFGLSKIKRNTLVSGGVRGTLPWMAPELLNGNSIKVSEKVDVFSFGVVLWEILTGEEPYANMHYGAIIGGIVNNTLRPAIPNYCDPEWRQLMEQCWTASPVARPSFTEIASRLRSMVSAASQAKAQGQKASN